MFDYQLELSTKLQGALRERRRALLSLPTGAGKTRTALHSFVQTAIQRGVPPRWIWMAPTLELLDQARRTVELLWTESWRAPDLRVAYRGDRPEGADIWFTTPQALSSRDNIDLAGFEAAVFDEAHQLGAPTFRAAATACERRGATILGLSATPGRSKEAETEQLVDFFQENLLVSDILGMRPIEELQSRGVLSRLRFKPIGDYSADWPADKRLRGLAWLAQRLNSQKRRTLIFAPSIAQGRALSIFLLAQGVPCAFIDGTTGDAQRSAVLAAFGAGALPTLINNRLLAVGYDCPAVSDVVLGMRVGSPLLFEQMVGRAARGPLTGGAATARVWQFDDHLKLHGLPASYYRYSLYDWSFPQSRADP